jgi:hypothetical protein
VELKDKLIEDRDAAHVESQQRQELLDRDENQLPSPIVEAIQDQGRERRAQLLGAVRMILGHQTLEVGQLRMPARETRALSALQVAVEGRSADLNEFVYATDRRDLLERALGVLQPDLLHTDDQSAHGLRAQLKDLSERVGELRHRLTVLEDAQDDLLRGTPEVAALTTEPTDKPGDKPAAKPAGAKPTVEPSDPDAPRPPTTLTGPGPDLPEPPPVRTTLAGGPDIPDRTPAKTTLTGADLPDRTPAPTTLVGPDLPDEPPAKTTLVGPTVPDEAPPPSTLGDAPDAANAPAPDGGDKPKRSWWRKPFG